METWTLSSIKDTESPKHGLKHFLSLVRHCNFPHYRPICYRHSVYNSSPLLHQMSSAKATESTAMQWVPPTPSCKPAHSPCSSCSPSSTSPFFLTSPLHLLQPDDQEEEEAHHPRPHRTPAPGPPPGVPQNCHRFLNWSTDLIIASPDLAMDGA